MKSLSIMLAVIATTISLQAGAIVPEELEGGPERAISGGKGPNRCEVSCIATCGRHPYADEILRVHNAIGFGDDQIKAFNTAVALCKTMAVPQCGMAEHSTPVSLTVSVYGRYELGLRNDKKKAYVGTYLKRDSVVEANPQNCKVN